MVTQLIPWTQLDNYQIILNTPEINLSAGRTNFPTKGREEATSKKVRIVDTEFGKETEHDCCGRQGAAIMEKD